MTIRFDYLESQVIPITGYANPRAGAKRKANLVKTRWVQIDLRWGAPT